MSHDREDLRQALHELLIAGDTKVTHQMVVECLSAVAAGNRMLGTAHDAQLVLWECLEKVVSNSEKWRRKEGHYVAQ